jgi:hypothetical protein
MTWSTGHRNLDATELTALSLPLDVNHLYVFRPPFLLSGGMVIFGGRLRI